MQGLDTRARRSTMVTCMMAYAVMTVHICEAFSPFPSVVPGCVAPHFTLSHFTSSLRSSLLDPKVFRAEKRRRPSGMQGCAMQEPTILFNFLAGGIAGTISSVATQPFYVAKTKMQQHSAVDRESDTEKGRADLLETLVSIVQRDGIMGLWAGALPVLIFAFPESALQLSTHDWVVNMMGKSGAEGHLPVLLQIVAGGLAGVPSVLATNPMDMLAISAADEQNAARCLAPEASTAGSQMLRDLDLLGIDGLFDGTSTTWLRDVPFLGIYFPLFTAISAVVTGLFATNPELLPEGLTAALPTTVAGTLAGVIASALTTPFDVINVAVKTRLLRKAVLSSEQAGPTELFFSTSATSDLRDIVPASSSSSTPSTSSATIRPTRLTLTTAFSTWDSLRTGQWVGVLSGKAWREGTLVVEVVRKLHDERGVAAYVSGMQARVSQVMPAQLITICIYSFLHWVHAVVP
jgi:hypothetical protein